MDVAKLTDLVDRLRREPHETEWLELKENYYEPKLLGEYLSALSNSACIHKKDKGYLIFGIRNKTHEVVGTSLNPSEAKKGNQDLRLWLANGLQPNVGYEVYRFLYHDKYVVVFQIHAAIDRPVSFYGRACIRIGEHKTELSKHPELARKIWENQKDWSAQICKDASIRDLSGEAIKKARSEYKIKYPQKSTQVDSWNDAKFLDKIKLTIHGGITNTSIILLGKPESSTLISPAVVRISWFLKDKQNREKDYEHFSPPFLLNVDRLYAKIRNLTYRHLPSGTLFPLEISQYDHWVIREALHNCVAHQDYSLRGRISVVETPDTLILKNKGSFLPGTVEAVIQQDVPPPVYRNPFLAEAMVNLNMIDTQGGGIKRMYQTQMKRYFPLPEYDLSELDSVTVRIRGEIIDERYTRLIMERTDLDLWTVILLDKVQRHIKISPDYCKKLRTLKVVEGRYPNIYISSKIASATGEKARHIRNRGLNKQYYQDMIIELIRVHSPVSREDINRLLIDKLPDVLTVKQKKTKIHNMLYELVEKDLIENMGSRRFSKWVLCD